MENNNVHTSVVIELANKTEPEEQKSYSIEIDDLNIPKDYVIDQIFCGENVTVYALFEIPETENTNMGKNLVEITSSNIDQDNRFYYKNSIKGIKERKSAGFPQNSCNGMSSEEMTTFFTDANKRESFYCLKHPSKNYDLLTPEKKQSDLKILYNKDFSTEKSTRFKAISVGVNTDIVQSPKIIEEAHKALGINIPMFDFQEKNVEIINPSCKPSCDVTDVETRPSFSSLASSFGSKNRNLNSISNFFFVPLIMMEDKSKTNKDDKAEKCLEEEKFSSRSKILVSSAVNTDSDKELQDDSTSKSSKTVFNALDLDPDLMGRLKSSEKKAILQEIKLMHLKLNNLIKIIESDECEPDEKEDEPIQLDKKKIDNSNSNVKIFQNVEVFSCENPTLLNCEAEGDGIKKSLTKLNLFISSEEIKTRENISLKNITNEIEKNYNENEVKSIKSVKSTGNLPTMVFSKIAEKPYFDTNPDNLLNPKKSLSSLTKETFIPDKISESDKRTCSDSEKPSTPNGSLRKIITANSNMKKDPKNIKKKNNRVKVSDLGSKTEIISKKLTANSRKLVRANAESRLHIDKLMKPESIKIPQSLKCISEEKPGPKGDRIHRPSYQKLDNKEIPTEIGNKETESKLSFKKSLPSQVENPIKKHPSPKLIIEPVVSIENAKETNSSSNDIPLPSSNPPPVVELLSKKPKSMKDLYSEISQDELNSDKISIEEDLTNTDAIVKKSRSQIKSNQRSQEELDIMKKSIVKSVWALTKVLFYEDGSKKLEVLEASLNPPGYSLNQPVKSAKQLENLNLVKNF